MGSNSYEPFPLEVLMMMRFYFKITNQP